MGTIDTLIRKNIRDLRPYSSARDEFTGKEAVFLDANENPYFQPLNRYPDPRQHELKRVISKIRSVPEKNIFIGNGSDEAIDLLIRAFCEPRIDNIVSVDPTYGMYEVAAAINGTEYRKAPLKIDFSIDIDALRQLSDHNTKIIFICSPNNPTGNSFGQSEIFDVLTWFKGVLVIDEAYIDFSGNEGFIREIQNYPNLVVMQTLSKAWGRAGIRVGMAFANEEIIGVMNKIKPPYNINSLSINEAICTLKNENEKKSRVREIIERRDWLCIKLSKLPAVKKIYHSDANFLLVKIENATELYNYLVSKNIIVRNRSGAAGCRSCLRITIGTEDETERLLKEMEVFNLNGS